MYHFPSVVSGYSWPRRTQVAVRLSLHLVLGLPCRLVHSRGVHSYFGIFTYLKKASHTIDYSILLLKFSHCGVRGVVYDWINNIFQFISTVYQYLYVYRDDVNSEEKLVIPQCSVLGPLLF